MEERFFCLKYSLAVLIEHAFSNIHTVGNVFAIGGEIVLELKSLARESAEIHEVFDICMAPVLEDAHSPGFTGVGSSPPPPRFEKVLELYRIRGKLAVGTLVSDLKHSASEKLMRVKLAATAAARD